MSPFLRRARRVAKWLIVPAAAVVGALAAVVLVFAIQARVRLPELHVWHTIKLEEEFHAGRANAPRSFEEYLALEGRLFAELRRRVLDDPSVADRYSLSRYRPGSIPARLALDTPYNRSYELAPAEPRGAVLLVHGLTDSPYSMRAAAETFYAEGYHVVVLRLPGHGTVPSSLVDVTWKDWYAAVVLAAKRAAQVAGPGRPFLAGGYSTGAALVTLYTLRSLDDPSLPRPDRLYLLSAAIGVSKLAVLTNVLAGMSFLPYFEKSNWLDVLPEYDPYKYNSFPVNAANQVYVVTRQLAGAMTDAKTRGILERMPPVVVFQSLVDATILASDVVRGLLAQLPAHGNELVVFDLNRNERLEALIAPGRDDDMDALKGMAKQPFRLTIIGNRAPDTQAVAAYTREAGAEEVREESLPLSWPPGVLSLGHVALPFPIDDPIYGLHPAPSSGPTIALGAVSIRGEAGAMIVPLGTLARIRCNPFFDVIRAKIRETLSAPSH